MGAAASQQAAPVYTGALLATTEKGYFPVSIPKVFFTLSREFGQISEVLRILDKKNIPYTAEAVGPTEWGYSGFHITFRDANGVSSEIQLTRPDVWNVKLESDAIYEKWRNITDTESLSPEEQISMITDMEKSWEMWCQLNLPDFSIYAVNSASDNTRALNIASAETGRTGLVQAPSTSSNMPLPSRMGDVSSTRPDSVMQATETTPFSDKYIIPENGEGVNSSRDGGPTKSGGSLRDSKLPDFDPTNPTDQMAEMLNGKPEETQRRNYGRDTVGAARKIDGTYYDLLMEYGALPRGEDVATGRVPGEGEIPSTRRIIDVPAKTGKNEHVTRAVRTLMESETTSPDVVSALQNAIVDGEFSYFRQSNHDLMTEAQSRVADDGFNPSLKNWERLMSKGRYKDGMDKRARSAALKDAEFGPSDLALGVQLYSEAVKAGDLQLAMRLATELAVVGHNSAQLLQANRLIKRMTPQGQLYYMQLIADKLSNNLKLRYGEHSKKARDIVIDENLANALTTATTQQEIHAAAEAMKQNIADQLPADWLELWNAWRYLSMLGNVKTNVRNLMGNIAQIPATSLKNVIKLGIEKGMIAAGHDVGRTVSILSKNDAPLLEFARADYENVKEIAMGQGKYADQNQSLSREIQEMRRIFKPHFLENYRVLSGKALDLGDVIFNRRAYRRALAGHLKANGITANMLKTRATSTTQALRAAREYAISEAQKATFRQAGIVADYISRLARSSTAADIIINGVLPFKKTPINILKTGINYSPIGLLKSLTLDMYRVKSNKITANEAIDNIAAGLSGTAITAIGAFLASLGIVTGGGDDDSRKLAHDKLTGWQAYSLKIGDVYYSIDWMTPVSLPFFVGVETFNALSKDYAVSVDSILDGLISISDPIYGLTMLQGLKDIIENAKYSDSPIASIALNAVTSYLTQGAPTLFGQVARIFDPTRRDPYNTGESGKVGDWSKTVLNRMFAKIPGLSTTLEPYIDRWGRKDNADNTFWNIFEQLLSPGYASQENLTDVDRYLQELYAQTGNNAVFPTSQSSQAGAIKRDGERVTLSPEERTEFYTVKGQTSFNTLESLTQNNSFLQLTEDEQADIIEQAYKYAGTVAKSALGADLSSDRTVKMMRAVEQGIDIDDVLLYFAMVDLDGSARRAKRKLQGQ